jgi:hypothetical protein
MAKELIHMLMEQNTLVNLKIINITAKELIHLLSGAKYVGEYIKDNKYMLVNMAKELLHLLMEKNMLVNIKMVKETAKELYMG